MNKTFLNVSAVCPFFVCDENTAPRIHYASITCEGIYGRRNSILFKKQEDKNAHAETFCSSLEGCKRCELYKLIEKKYKK